MADIKSDKIRNIIERSAVELVQLVGDIEAQVERALQELDDGEKLTLNHAIVIDFEGDKLTNKVSCTLKATGTSECQLPSANQDQLPGIENPDDAAKKAVRKFTDGIQKSIAEGGMDAVTINFPGTGKGVKIDKDGIHASN